MNNDNKRRTIMKNDSKKYVILELIGRRIKGEQL